MLPAVPNAPAPPELEALTTPLAWAGSDGAISGCNQAFARWLGVGMRRLHGRQLKELDSDGRVAEALDKLGSPDA
ncbi:MAG: hypothetical protein M3414_03975, partial [Pseudomonadota bacterium]|nr:hypothetical protein [Pseudomonadota bacterium]